jgi:hypothetical protein
MQIGGENLKSTADIAIEAASKDTGRGGAFLSGENI